MNLKQTIWWVFLATCVLEIVLYVSPKQVAIETKKSVEHKAHATSVVEERADFDVRSHNPKQGHDSYLFIDYWWLLHSHACSYKAKVDEIKATLYELYPRTLIVENEYPLWFPWTLLSQYFLYRLLSSLRIVIIILSLGGDYLFQKLQIPVPRWYQYMQEKKLIVMVFAIFGINMISSLITSTGAFEVLYEGQLIFSGLKNGRAPQVEELIAALQGVDLHINY